MTSPPDQVNPTVLKRLGYNIKSLHVDPLELTVEVDRDGKPWTHPVAVGRTLRLTARGRGLAIANTRPHAWLYASDADDIPDVGTTKARPERSVVARTPPA